MPPFKLLISEKRIKQKLKKISKQLLADYQGEEVTIVMVMKGALCLVSDLMRVIEFPATLECISASSYGTKGTERGELTVTGLKDIQTKDKHILIVDDVFDTGQTLSHIVSEFKKQPAKSVKSLVLLSKNNPRPMDYVPEYCLFEIGNAFVIGYGMDYKEFYRGLPGIYIFQD